MKILGVKNWIRVYWKESNWKIFHWKGKVFIGKCLNGKALNRKVMVEKIRKFSKFNCIVKDGIGLERSGKNYKKFI